MCGRFDTSHLTWRDIHAQLSAFAPVLTPPLNLEPNADVRPTTNQLIARVEDGGWVLEKARWGLVPFWRNTKPLKDTARGSGDGFRLSTFNCRVEGCATSNTFKGAFARRRCIVPSSAWFEWTGPASGKTKHRFDRADGKAIWFAGLWDRCTTSDMGDLTSFTIMTGPSAGVLAEYHDRAPVVLEEADWSTWLDPTQDAMPLFEAVRPQRFEVAPG